MSDVLFERRHALGLITLNRPKALNALNQPMAVAIHRQLDEWAADSGIRSVAITGAGERAFCAGGDIRALYEWGRAGDPSALRFYHDEYRLNDAIKHYPKPYVALIDGIVMGGGVGLSVHGSHRVLSERALLAMPETGIGFFPDVGGSYFLARCPGRCGYHLGLTGARIQIADALALGIATHFVSSAKLPEILERLARGAAPDDAILAEPAPNPTLAQDRATIDRCFDAPSVEAILERLSSDGGEFAQKTLATLRLKSPTALKVTHRAIRNGAGLSFKDCMRMEYRLTHRFWTSPDYLEGVRSVIIDKDNQPKWQPPSLEAVDERLVDAYFQPVEKELEFA